MSKLLFDATRTQNKTGSKLAEFANIGVEVADYNYVISGSIQILFPNAMAAVVLTRADIYFPC